GLAAPPIRLSGLQAVLLAHIFYNYTVVLRLVGGFWANLDPRLEEAAAAADRRVRPRYVGRREAASPATGFYKVHNAEQAVLVEEALSV
ncbi:MAG: hypothetical protein ACK4ST_12730, partial [Elioraea tepidiphila]